MLLNQRVYVQPSPKTYAITGVVVGQATIVENKADKDHLSTRYVVKLDDERPFAGGWVSLLVCDESSLTPVHPKGGV